MNVLCIRTGLPVTEETTQEIFQDLGLHAIAGDYIETVMASRPTYRTTLKHDYSLNDLSDALNELQDAWSHIREASVSIQRCNEIIHRIME